MSKSLKEQIRLLDEAIAAAGVVQVPSEATAVEEPGWEKWGLDMVDLFRLANYEDLPQPGEEQGNRFGGLVSVDFLEEPDWELEFYLPQDMGRPVTAPQAAWLFERGWVVEAQEEFLWVKPDHQDNWQNASQDELLEEIDRLGLASSSDKYIARYIFELQRYGRILFKGERHRAIRYGDDYMHGLRDEEVQTLRDARRILKRAKNKLCTKRMGLDFVDGDDNDDDYIIETPARQASTAAPAQSQRVLRSMVDPKPVAAPVPQSPASSSLSSVQSVESSSGSQYDLLSKGPGRLPSPLPQERMVGQAYSRLKSAAIGGSKADAAPAEAAEVEVAATTHVGPLQKSSRKTPATAVEAEAHTATNIKKPRKSCRKEPAKPEDLATKQINNPQRSSRKVPISAVDVKAPATTQTKSLQKSCRKGPVAAPAQAEHKTTRAQSDRASKRPAAPAETKEKVVKALGKKLVEKKGKADPKTSVQAKKAPRKRLAPPKGQKEATEKRPAKPKAPKKVTGKRAISEVEDDEYEPEAGPSAATQTAGKTTAHPSKRPRIGGKTEETMAKIAEIAAATRANERAANPPASRNVWKPENHTAAVNSSWTCDWVDDEGAVCGLTTDTKLDGQNHLFSHHVPEKKKMGPGQMFTCSMGACNHTHRATDAPKISGHFDKSDKLKSHIRAIMDVREYGCPWEDYGCMHRSNRCTDITFHRKKCSFRPETKEQQDAAILAKGYKVLRIIVG
ncbi:hypothetical protein TWF694_009322 [Orbilia ellipsospora]|uniref:Uncharacterized protein n=1 Tax=Orbilia ellipsospora TaxID=2528407 RepID=A0AAV9XG31_9PEZI